MCKEELLYELLCILPDSVDIAEIKWWDDDGMHLWDTELGKEKEIHKDDKL